jgi:hypothetical protein
MKIASVAALTAVVQSQCATIQTHVEWRELTPQQQTDYLNGIKCLREKPTKLKNGFSTTLFEDLAAVHASAGEEIHGVPAFLPWHRVFLAVHDQLLRNECNYKGPMPYWDWTFDSQAPDKSPIWTSFGKTKRGCLTIPALGAMRSNVPSNHCVTRQWIDNDLLSAQYNSVQMQLIMGAKTFNAFRENLEGAPHNSVHVAIGGDMSDVGMSPNDPIFYMHHRNIDRHWWRWQRRNPKLANTYTGVTNMNVQAKKTDTMRFFGLIPDTTVQRGMNASSNALNGLMCFRYSNSVKPKTAAVTKRSVIAKRDVSQGIYNSDTPAPTDRSDKFNIRVPKPIDTAFLKKMKYSDARIAALRKTEDTVKRLSEFVNSMPIVFPETLGDLETGEVVGYRPKTDAEVIADEKLTTALVKAFGEFLEEQNI